MHYHALVPLAAAVVNLIVCIPVVRQGMRKPIFRAFLWMTLTVVAWNLDLFSLYYFSDAASAEWWSRLFRTGVCFAPATAFHAALALSGSWRRPWTYLLFAGYATGVVLAVANARGALVAGLTPHTWGWYIQPTRAYGLLTLLLIIYLPLIVERSWHAYRHPSSPRQRVEAKFWLLGAAVQTPLSLTNLLPAYGLNVYPLGTVGNVIYVSVIAYAIVRHRLMDVDYVVRKLISFLLAAAVVLAPGAAGLYALSQALQAEAPGGPQRTGCATR